MGVAPGLYLRLAGGNTGVVLPQKGGCRVMSYCHQLAALCVSQPSASPLFAGYGFKKVSDRQLHWLQAADSSYRLIQAADGSNTGSYRQQTAHTGSYRQQTAPIQAHTGSRQLQYRLIQAADGSNTGSYKQQMAPIQAHTGISLVYSGMFLISAPHLVSVLQLSRFLPHS